MSAQAAVGGVAGVMPSGRTASILGTAVNEVDYATTVNQLCRWAETGQSRYVCFLTVHMVMEGFDDPAFRSIVNAADLVAPDGMPIMMTSRLMGLGAQTRVTGPKTLGRLCAEAAVRGLPVGFYGSTPAVLDSIKRNLAQHHPNLKVAYAHSPPFRALSEDEKAAVVEEINASGAKLIFVGLGCPKQERWMSEMRGKVRAVMLGVGFAFDLHSGVAEFAPEWMQTLSLEWLYRLFKDPKRLWKRYLTTNPRYLYFLSGQMLGLRKYRTDPAVRRP